MFLVPQLLELDRGRVVKGAMKTLVIVFLKPALEEHLRLEK